MKLIDGRECGDCSICCEMLEIKSKELNKPAGQLCQYRAKVGCAIYQERPFICQQWYCMWRWFPFAENVRPDKSKILISYEAHPELKYKVIIARDLSEDASAFKQPGFEHIVRSMLKQGHEVWCYQKDKPIFKSTLANPVNVQGELEIATENDLNSSQTTEVFLRLLS